MINDYAINTYIFKEHIGKIISDRSIPFEQRWSIFELASEVDLTETVPFKDYQWDSKYNFSHMFYYPLFNGKRNEFHVIPGEIITIKTLKKLCDNHGLLKDFYKFAVYYMDRWIGKLIM